MRLPAAIRAPEEKAREGVDRLLARLMQHGGVPISTVNVAIKALQAESAKDNKDDKIYTRIVYYLLQLGFGDGSAGTPLVIPSNKGVQPW